MTIVWISERKKRRRDENTVLFYCVAILPWGADSRAQ
jgi:hypothetical protein